MRCSSSVAEGPITIEMLQDGLQMLEEEAVVDEEFSINENVLALPLSLHDYAAKPPSSTGKYEMYTIKISVLHIKVLFTSMRQLTARFTPVEQQNSIAKSGLATPSTSMTPSPSTPKAIPPKKQGIREKAKRSWMEANEPKPEYSKKIREEEELLNSTLQSLSESMKAVAKSVTSNRRTSIFRRKVRGIECCFGVRPV